MQYLSAWAPRTPSWLARSIPCQGKVGGSRLRCTRALCCSFKADLVLERREELGHCPFCKPEAWLKEVTLLSAADAGCLTNAHNLAPLLSVSFGQPANPSVFAVHVFCGVDGDGSCPEPCHAPQPGGIGRAWQGHVHHRRGSHSICCSALPVQQDPQQVCLLPRVAVTTRAA